MSLRGPVPTPTTEARRAEFDGTGRTDGNQKCPSMFFILCGNIEHVYIYTCIQNKSCRQHSYGFQNLMSSWGSGSKFSNLQQVGDFFIFGSKSPHVYGRNFENHTRTFFWGWESKFLIFWDVGGIKFEFWWG